MSLQTFDSSQFKVTKFSLYSVCSSGREISFSRLGSMCFWDVCPVHHIWICNLHDLWIEFSARLEQCLLKCQTTVVLPDLANRTYARVNWNQLIWVAINCSNLCTIHVAISKLIGSMNQVQLRFQHFTQTLDKIEQIMIAKVTFASSTPCWWKNVLSTYLILGTYFEFVFSHSKNEHMPYFCIPFMYC